MKINNVLIIVLFMLSSVFTPLTQGVVHDYYITATAGPGGLINPSGSVGVDEGQDKQFSISANPGYRILDVIVDSVSQGIISSYTFINVADDHTIHATFELDTPPSTTSITGDYLGYIDKVVRFEDGSGSTTGYIALTPNGSAVFFNYKDDQCVYGHHTNDNYSVTYDSEPSYMQYARLAMSPNGTRLVATGEMSGQFVAYTLSDYIISTFQVLTGTPTIYDIVFSPNSSRVAYVGAGNVISIREFATWFPFIGNISVGNCCAQLDWYDNWLVVTLSDSVSLARVYYANNRTLYKNLYASGSFAEIDKDVEFSPDGSWLAVAHSDLSSTGYRNKINIFNVSDLFSLVTVINTSFYSEGGPFSISFSNDSRHLFAAYESTVLAYSTVDWSLVYDIDVGLAYDEAATDMGVTSNLIALADDSNDNVKLLTIFSVNRTVASNFEYNNISFELPTNITGLQNFVIPVSSDTVGVSAHSPLHGINATQVYFLDYLLDNNSFYYDEYNSTIHLRLGGLTSGTPINWSIICTYEGIFEVNPPQYREVGDYLFASGLIYDSDGDVLHNVVVTTYILNLSGSALITTHRNCVNGDYFCTFSTSTIEAGTYIISIEFEDPVSGETMKQQSTLYLSVDPGPGIHVSTNLHFSFYNSNTGLGLPSELFRIYVGSDPAVLSLIYNDFYKVYTGSTIYYRIDDYHGNQVYPFSGSYRSLYISSITQQEGIPITWYDVAVKNLNTTIMFFSLLNGSIYYNVTLFPMDTYHFNVLPMGYNITIITYNAFNGSMIQTTTDTIDVTGDCFYIASGYTAHIYFSLYNTNEGLGIPWDTLRFYVDGVRLTEDRWYHGYINQTVNLVITDYYNFTMYDGNFTLNDTYTFIDLGLTFHSWLFGNNNEDYYMISLLREGAVRWWERGIVPKGEREYMLPSGNYTLRIYDRDWTEIYNMTHVVNRSMVYVIHGTNLSEILIGQSVIRGQLLELSSDIDYALMPDAVIWARNPCTIFSVFDRIGQQLGTDVWKVCPPLNVIAMTRNSSYDDTITSVPLIPTNGTTANGTITVIEDTLYLSGGSTVTWVNITYSNGTVLQNTTYIPNKIILQGETVWINASSDIHVLRETYYSQTRMFYWNIYNSTTNPGHIAGRAGYHNTGITVTNPLNTSLYSVYVYAGFSDLTTPDYNSVQVTDVDNGIILESGENFKVSGSGIEFKIQGGMSPLETREFTLGYYKDTAHTYYYDDAQVVLYYYETGKVLSIYEDLFNRAEFMWVNPRDLAFRGSLKVKFGFSLDLDKDNVKVFDLDRQVEVSQDDLIVSDEFVWISSSAVGSVQPGGTRSFALYFTELEFPGLSLSQYHLNTPLVIIMGLPITMFSIIVSIGVLVSAGGSVLILRTRKYKDRYVLMVLLGATLIFVFWVLQSKGV